MSIEEFDSCSRRGWWTITTPLLGVDRPPLADIRDQIVAYDVTHEDAVDADELTESLHNIAEPQVISPALEVLCALQAHSRAPDGTLSCERVILGHGHGSAVRRAKLAECSTPCEAIEAQARLRLDSAGPLPLLGW